MSNEILKREIKEALVAGQIALYSLQIAEERLEEIRCRGILERMGESLRKSLQKNTKVDDAAYYLTNARDKLLMFQRELQKLSVPKELKGKIGAYLAFADFFLDGRPEDYLVQSKVSETRSEVTDALWRVSSLLKYLQTKYEKML